MKTLEDLEKDLQQAYDWIEVNEWNKLPQGMKSIIAVGIVQVENRIKAKKNDFL